MNAGLRAADGAAAGSTVPPPRSPLQLADSGLTLGFLSELVLKLLYVHGSLLGQEIAQQIRLPFPIVDEALRFLKDQRCIEVSSGDLLGRVSYRFALTELGRLRAREVFEQCRYVGPAPVAMEQYVAQSRRQTVTGIPCSPEALKLAFQEFILRPGLVDELGPAVCTGRSVFVYGPPGNGKTVIAKGLGRYLNTYGGEIYVPYALLAENTIITVYDPVLHQTTDDAELARRGMIPRAAAAPIETTTAAAPDTSADLRWRRIRRPVIITGGELTLDMLELQHHKTGNFYNAPLHIKANGGVFLIDDFGRQLVSPRDLLNRWIVPLEERIDYLTLATGRKFAFPFEQLIIFSTNLDPKDLVDDAFLRRIRYKVRVDPPSREVFQQIFDLACRQRSLPPSQAVVDYLFQTYYDRGRPPRSSDPRDFLDLIQAECRFQGQPVEWTEPLVAHTARRLFHQI
uniref:ATPase n=1 Tax=Schlesneria paludicola TaxID=360056 RepID=A0A7C2JZN1_9PLAN